MEPNPSDETVTNENKQLGNLNKVTPVSKTLAVILFIALPFVGGWIGYSVAPEKIVEIETVIVKEVDRETTPASTRKNPDSFNVFERINQTGEIPNFPRNSELFDSLRNSFWSEDAQLYAKMYDGREHSVDAYGNSLYGQKLTFTNEETEQNKELLFEDYTNAWPLGWFEKDFYYVLGDTTSLAGLYKIDFENFAPQAMPLSGNIETCLPTIVMYS